MKAKKSQKTPRGKAQVEEDEDVFGGLHEWHEEVSRTSIQTFGTDEFEFNLEACGFGIPPEILKISTKGMPERELEIGIDREQIQHLATWLVECLCLLESLRHKKAEEILKTQTQLVRMHRREWFQEWSKKFANYLR